MVRFQKNKRSGQKSMSRCFLFIVLLIYVLIHSGCASLKTPLVDYSTLSLVIRRSSQDISLLLTVNESNVLRCECDGVDAEIVGMKVRLFTMASDKILSFDGGKLRLGEDVSSVLYNPVTRSLWTSKVCLQKFPYYVRCFYDGGERGHRGCIHSERCFNPHVQLPNDVSDYGCIGCEIWLKVHGKVEILNAYLFRRGIDVGEIKNLRRLYLTDASSAEWGCIWEK